MNYIYKHIQIHSELYTQIYASTHGNIHTNICKYTWKYTHKYIQIHMEIYPQIYTNTHSRGIFDVPKSIVVFVKHRFSMEVLNLMEEKFEEFRDSLTERFTIAFTRRNKWARDSK